MTSAYERAAAEFEPEFCLLKVNTEEEAEVARRYGIPNIPTIMLFARGDPIAQTAGAMNSAGTLKWVRAHARQEH